MRSCGASSFPTVRATRPPLSYLALALLGEERQLGRVKPALTVRRHVTAAARELQGKHKPKPKPKHRLRKVLGAALVAAVVIAALRKERAAARDPPARDLPCRLRPRLAGEHHRPCRRLRPRAVRDRVPAELVERIGKRTKATTGTEAMIGKRPRSSRNAARRDRPDRRRALGGALRARRLAWYEVRVASVRH